MSHRPPIPPHYPTITKRPITLPFPPPHIQYAVTDQSRGDQNDGWRLTCGLSEARMETHKSHEWGSEIVPISQQILTSCPESHHTSFNNLRWEGFSHLGGAQNNRLQKYCTNHKTYHHHILKPPNSPFEGVSHLRRAQWSLVWPSAPHRPPPGTESTLFIWTSVPSLSYTSSSSGNHQATFLQVLSFCCYCVHARATS